MLLQDPILFPHCVIGSVLISALLTHNLDIQTSGILCRRLLFIRESFTDSDHLKIVQIWFLFSGPATNFLFVGTDDSPSFSWHSLSPFYYGLQRNAKKRNCWDSRGNEITFPALYRGTSKSRPESRASTDLHDSP